MYITLRQLLKKGKYLEIFIPSVRGLHFQKMRKQIRKFPTIRALIWKGNEIGNFLLDFLPANFDKSED